MKQNTLKIPENVSFEQAAFLEPLACVVHGIELSDIKTGDFVLLDTKGKPILSCEERENTNDKCRVPAEQFRKLCQTESQAPVMTDQKQGVEGPVIKDLKLGYCIFEYKVNPTCISYVNRITGQVYQVCW